MRSACTRLPSSRLPPWPSSVSPTRRDRLPATTPGASSAPAAAAPRAGPSSARTIPKVVVEGCDMTGAYITKDGGESWRMFSLGAPPDGLRLRPEGRERDLRRHGRPLAERGRGPDLDHGLPRSRQEHRGPRVDRPRRLRDHHRRPGLRGQRPGRGHPRRSRVDPSDTRLPRHGGEQRRLAAPGLARRRRRASWSRATGAAPGPGSGSSGTERVFAIRIAGTGRRAGRRAVGETAASTRAADGGWQRSTRRRREALSSASFGTDAASRVAACSTSRPRSSRRSAGPWAASIVSEDGGHTWRGAPSGASSRRRRASARAKPGAAPRARGRASGRSPRRPATDSWPTWVSAGSARSADGAKFNGIAKTIDGGRTWTVVHEEADRAVAPTSRARGSRSARPPTGTRSGSTRPTTWPWRPTNPDVCFATDLFRTYRTLDGGTTWGQVNSARRGEDRWVSRGLDVTNAYGIHWDPFDAKRVFISNTDTGLFRSEDGGRDLDELRRGRSAPLAQHHLLGRRSIPRCRASCGAPSARPTTCRARRCGATRIPTGSRAASASRPTAAGRGSGRARGCPKRPRPTSSSIPASPKGRRTLYATGFGRGVFKSTDNGATWSPKNAGLERPQPFAWRLTRAGRRHAVPRGGAPQRARRDRRRAGRRALSFHRRRRALDAPHPARRDERPQRAGRGSQGSAATVPRGLGTRDPRRRHGRRDLRHDRRRGRRGRPCSPPTSTSTTSRSIRAIPAILYASGLRPIGLPLGGPRRDLDAHSRLQLQVGAAGDSGPAGPDADLRHDLRRRRLARARGRRPGAAEDVVPSDRFRSGGR